jgi:hypothetical protein
VWRTGIGVARFKDVLCFFFQLTIGAAEKVLVRLGYICTPRPIHEAMCAVKLGKFSNPKSTPKSGRKENVF